MKLFAQFIGNYFKHDAQPGEDRTGEAILKIDIDNNIIVLNVNGLLIGEWKLSKSTGDAS